jgi:hypothetical protein
MANEIAFRGRIRHWKEDPPGGLAVIDIPAELVERLGGRRQYRVDVSLGKARFQGSTMLVAGGGYAFGISKANLKAAGVDVGDEVDVKIRRAG